MISMAANIVLAIGVRAIFRSGRMTAGHAAFVGMGAYASVLLVKEWDVSFWWGLILGGVGAGLVALVIGSIVLRTGGIYFAIITLAIGEAFIFFIKWAESITGGSAGVWRIPTPTFEIPGLVSIEFGIDREPYYYLIIIIMIIAFLFFHLLEKSRFGREIFAMSQNDILAQHAGINIFRHRLVPFVAACFFAGVVGSFLAHYHQVVHPDEYRVMASFHILIFAIVGGLGSILGPIVGTIFMLSLTEFLHSYEELVPLITGFIVVFVVVLFPRGLIGIPGAVVSTISGIPRQIQTLYKGLVHTEG